MGTHDLYILSYLSSKEAKEELHFKYTDVQIGYAIMCTAHVISDHVSYIVSFQGLLNFS